jgi:hypothetical protein
MSSQNTSDLARKIQQLQADRQHHVEAMAAIDRVLGTIDQALRGAIPEDPPTTAGGGDGAAVHREAPATEPRRRGRFQLTGVDSVLDFIRRQVDPSTAEINAHWRNEGRKGTANVTLLKLLKDGMIRREADPTIRGSRYRAANRNASAAPAHRLNATPVEN